MGFMTLILITNYQLMAEFLQKPRLNHFLLTYCRMNVNKIILCYSVRVKRMNMQRKKTNRAICGRDAEFLKEIKCIPNFNV